MNGSLILGQTRPRQHQNTVGLSTVTSCRNILWGPHMCQSFLEISDPISKRWGTSFGKKSHVRRLSTPCGAANTAVQQWPATAGIQMCACVCVCVLSSGNGVYDGIRYNGLKKCMCLFLEIRFLEYDFDWFWSIGFWEVAWLISRGML